MAGRPRKNCGCRDRAIRFAKAELHARNHQHPSSAKVHSTGYRVVKSMECGKTWVVDLTYKGTTICAEVNKL